MPENNERKIIITEIERNPNATVKHIAEQINSQIEHDIKNLTLLDTMRKIRQILNSFKDDEDVRTYFSNGAGRYINIETSENLLDLENVQTQIQARIKGLDKSHKKVLRRKRMVLEQFTLFDDETQFPAQ